MIIIKLIFKYQMTQERVVFFFSKMKKNKWKMRTKIIYLCLTSILSLETKRKHVIVGDEYNSWEIQNIMKKKIKIS